MLDVSGLIVIPQDPQLRRAEAQSGYFLNFTIVSIDKEKKPHRYQASMFIKSDELDEWERKIKPGNVFYISHARWEMREYKDNKYPIPQLKLDKFRFNKLTTPYWLEEDEKK